MAGIFISYRRNDSAGWVQVLRRALAAHFGEELVFIDVVSLEWGAHFLQEINRRLDSSDVVLVVIGPRWLGEEPDGRVRITQRNDFVRLEVAGALRRRPHVHVRPVLVDGARMPAPERLPPNIRGITELNARELRNESLDADLALFIEQLEPILSQNIASSPPAPMAEAVPGLTVPVEAGAATTAGTVEAPAGPITPPDRGQARSAGPVQTAPAADPIPSPGRVPTAPGPGPSPVPSAPRPAAPGGPTGETTPPALASTPTAARGQAIVGVDRPTARGGGSWMMALAGIMAAVALIGIGVFTWVALSPPPPPPPTPTRKILLSDDFDTPDTGQLSRTSPTPGDYTFGYSDGTYVIAIVNPDLQLSQSVLVPGTYDDSVLAIDVRLVGDVVQRHASVACRIEGAGGQIKKMFQATLVPNDRELILVSWDAGAPNNRIEARDPGIETGDGWNHVELQCDGTKISASVNGKIVASLDDPSPSRGLHSIGAGTFVGTTGTTEAHFDNLRVTAP